MKSWNPWNRVCRFVCSVKVIFLVELVVKMIALGGVCGYAPYLK